MIVARNIFEVIVAPSDLLILSLISLTQTFVPSLPTRKATTTIAQRGNVRAAAALYMTQSSISERVSQPRPWS